MYTHFILLATFFAQRQLRFGGVTVLKHHPVPKWHLDVSCTHITLNIKQQ